MARAKNIGAVFTWAERLFLVGGLVLFVYLLRRLGAGTVKDNLELVGGGIALIVLQELLAYSANTLGWWAAFPKPRIHVPLPTLFSARIVGDAINYLTPTAGLGGEFIRARLLRAQLGGTAVVASITVAKLSQVVGQIVFVVVGLIVIIDQIALPPAMRRGLLIGMSLLSGLMAVLVFVQRRGMFSPIWRFAERLGITAQAPEFGRQLQRLDREIARFHLDADGSFFLSAAFFFVGWALGVVEVYLIMWLLNEPVTVEVALQIEVLSIAFDGIFFFVPAKLGTQEAGKVLIFKTLGLDPATGLSFGILRHIRELSWSLIGLGILFTKQTRASWRGLP